MTRGQRVVLWLAAVASLYLAFVVFANALTEACVWRPCSVEHIALLLAALAFMTGAAYLALRKA